MKNIPFCATTLLLTIALFCTNNLSAQWSQNSASIWNTNLNLNLGVGTSTPGAKLSVVGSNAPTLELRNTTADFARIRLANSNNGYWDVAGKIGTTDADDRLNFFNNAAGNVLSLTGAGNVGIGTVTPTAKFQIGQGNLHVDSGYGIEFGDQTPNTFHSKIWEDQGSKRLFVYPGGRIDPNAGTEFGHSGVMEILGAVNINTSPYDGYGRDLTFGGPNSGEGLGSRRQLGNNQYGLDFFTNSYTRLSITNNGKVGVGTTTPNQKLQVNGGDGISLGFGDGNTFEGIGSKRTSGGNQWGLDFYTSGATRMSINNSGNVGIGISPSLISYRLDVSGNIRCYALYQTSDRRYKNNIKTLDGAMGKIMAMRGTSYDFAPEQLPEGYVAGKQVGFIAQEMKTVMPELVKEDDKGMLAVNYIGVIPVLVEALKEQHEVIAEKETRITALEAQNTELQSRLARIEAALGIAADRQTEVKTAPVSAKASPNPTSGLVTIDWQNTAAAKPVVVNIVDAAGRQVATRIAAGTSCLQFDLSQLPAGVYVAQVIADGKMVSSNKVQLVK